MSPWHCKASNTQLKPGLSRLSPWPHQYKTSPPHPHNPPLSVYIRSFRIQNLPENKVLDRETTAWFKQATSRLLLDRLARDALQSPTKDIHSPQLFFITSCNLGWGYIKTLTMLRDIVDACTPLVGSTNTDYSNKFFVALFLFLIPSLSRAQHPSSFVPYRWHLPPYMRYQRK